MKDRTVEKEINDAENFIKLQVKRTELSKHSFIEEIKGDLGHEINKDTGRYVKPKERGIKGFINKLKKMF
jgi:hypothetical protein